MEIEEKLQRAERLSNDLIGIDDNELKKVFSFLIKTRSLKEMFRLLEVLPSSPFARRSRRTRNYYEKIKEVIPRHIRKDTDVQEAIDIIGWSCRLLRYKATRRAARREERRWR